MLNTYNRIETVQHDAPSCHSLCSFSTSITLQIQHRVRNAGTVHIGELQEAQRLVENSSIGEWQDGRAELKPILPLYWPNLGKNLLCGFNTTVKWCFFPPSNKSLTFLLETVAACRKTAESRDYGGVIRGTECPTVARVTSQTSHLTLIESLYSLPVKLND